MSSARRETVGSPCTCCNRLLEEKDWEGILDSYAPILAFWHELDRERFPKPSSRTALRRLLEEGQALPTPLALYCQHCRRLRLLEWGLIEGDFKQFLRKAREVMKSAPQQILAFCREEERRLVSREVHRSLRTYTEWLLDEDRSDEEISEGLREIEQFIELVLTPRLSILFALREKACALDLEGEAKKS